MSRVLSSLAAMLLPDYIQYFLQSFSAPFLYQNSTVQESCFHERKKTSWLQITTCGGHVILLITSGHGNGERFEVWFRVWRTVVIWWRHTERTLIYSETTPLSTLSSSRPSNLAARLQGQVYKEHVVTARHPSTAYYVLLTSPAGCAILIAYFDSCFFLLVTTTLLGLTI